ncbi:MAG: NHL repeat-containing protein [Spirochaetales bacterium]|nr:NHL repeat-containing protein [Spirochaetales bacterium]
MITPARLGRLPIVILVFTLGSAFVAAQTIDMDAAQAREEFRWGVQAYHATRFNDAIVAFNRALSFAPEDVLSREWLGRAYFRSGFEDAAVAEWDIVAGTGTVGAYLLSRLETVRYRQGLLPFADENLTLVRSQLLSGLQGEARLFRRPVGLAAEPNGDVFAVSLGTQEVLRIGPNGRIVRRLQGGIEGLDQPFDVAWHDGELFVSEFGGDRVAVLDERGAKVRTLGGTGLGEGELLGPQYLAVDEEFVYVSEWGNRRVSKFDREGAFVLSFGSPTPFFAGLARPTGVAARGGLVYVADADEDGVALHVFDESGNHRRRIDLPLSRDDAPADSISGAVLEDINWYGDDRLLIATGNRVLVFDPFDETVETVVTDGERRRVSSAALDVNGRVVMSDFDSDEIGIFEPEGTLYSGLDVRVERIIARDFPQVALQVAVHDRDGSPVVGLERENFIVSERGIPRPDAAIESGGQLTRRLDTVMLLQPRSGQTYAVDAARAVADLAELNGADDSLWLYRAGAQTELVLSGPASPERFSTAAAGSLVDGSDSVARGEVRLDEGIRIASTQLLERGLRRNLVVVGDGSLGDGAFREYGVQELAAFLVNNGIRLHLVLLRQGTPDAELDYLVEATGGTARFLYEPEGLAPLVADFLSSPSGRYWLVFDSIQDPDFGRRYIDVSVEARLFVRSGRDELGFFPPQ